MTKAEAQREVVKLRKGISAQFGAYKVVTVMPPGAWGIKFTPTNKARKTSIYKG